MDHDPAPQNAALSSDGREPNANVTRLVLHVSDRSHRPIGLHFAWLLSVATTVIFVTTLILITRDLAALWPLYVVPIVIAAIAYHVAGAVLVTAVATALVAFITYSGGAGATPMTDVVVGMAAFAVAGIVVGVQTERFQRQKELAETDCVLDPLTGAHRAEYFDDLLHTEVRRCERYDLECTLVLVEVGDFTGFARKYGNLKADLLLARLVAVLRTSVRDTDEIGRHGAHAFAVILPFTDAEKAAPFIERIAATIETTDFEGDALEPVAHCGVTIASASYPRDATLPVELMEVARARLEQARRAGAASETAGGATGTATGSAAS